MIRAPLLAAGLAFLSGSAWCEAPSTFDHPTICRVTIGAIMGRDPKIIRTTKTEGDVSYQRYTRASDNTVWSTRCRVQGSRVYWASEPGGRWRDDPRDEVINYKIENGSKQLTITESYSDGTATVKSFSKGQF